MEGEVYDQHGRRIDQSPRATRRRVWVQHGARTGVGMGSALAIAISWSLHHSILWAIVHGLLSWVYVAWYALTR